MNKKLKWKRRRKKNDKKKYWNFLFQKMEQSNDRTICMAWVGPPPIPSEKKNDERNVYKYAVYVYIHISRCIQHGQRQKHNAKYSLLNARFEYNIVHIFYRIQIKFSEHWCLLKNERKHTHAHATALTRKYSRQNVNRGK